MALENETRMKYDDADLKEKPEAPASRGDFRHIVYGVLLT
jgi:hypothetical protein